MIHANALEENTKNMDPNLIIAEIKAGVQGKLFQYPDLELEKFLEDVGNGIYNLAFGRPFRPLSPPLSNPPPQNPQNQHCLRVFCIILSI